MSVTQQQVLDALGRVASPRGVALTGAGVLSAISVTDGKVFFSINVDAAEAAAWESVRAQAEAAVRGIPGVTAAMVALTAERKPGAPAPSAAPAPHRHSHGVQPVSAHRPPQGAASPMARQAEIPGVAAVIAVASGKGGVGKSTMTANLAAALTAEGHPAGALDCDVYGYSIPRMLGVNAKPEVNGERKILPLDSPSGVKVMSIGFFVEDNSAVVWRGPMLHKAIQQFLEDVAWDELEYLLLDLPPGTGDVSMTLAQLLPQAKFVVVTTPQPAAQSVARRGAQMASKFDLEILGVIENMSGFTTPDGERFTIFGEGGGQLLADELDVPLLGKVPLSEPLREHADSGSPLVTAEPDAPASQAIRQAARGIIAMTPQELPVLQAEPNAAEMPPISGTPLPVVQ